VLQWGDYRLQQQSPALDQGSEVGAPAVDIAGNERPCGAGVDMGAYEYGACSGPPFVRGDTNGDGWIDMTDAICIIFYLFGEEGDPSREMLTRCLDAADVNDDAEVGTTGITVADAVFLLRYLFQMDREPPAPFPSCGVDESPDHLDCQVYEACR
jgi:hypothetical protein